MEPNFQFKGLDPANQFAMDGLNMAYTAEFIYNDKPIPKGLFLDIMIEKTQMLVTHLKHIQPGLMLATNLSDNIATIKLYDLSLEDSLKLHMTISNIGDIEDQLYRLWIEVHGVLHDY